MCVLGVRLCLALAIVLGLEFDMLQMVAHFLVQFVHLALQILQFFAILLNRILKLCTLKGERIVSGWVLLGENLNLPWMSFILFETLAKSREAVSLRSWARFLSVSLTSDFWSILAEAVWNFFSNSSAP